MKTIKSKHNLKSSQSNWYAKLHPIGTEQQVNIPKRPLNLSIFFRIWLAVALVLIICGVVVFTQLFSYVKPTVKQVIEDTLLDTSKLLAVNFQLPLQSGELYTESYHAQLDTAFSTLLADDTFSGLAYDKKTHTSFRVYVTDNNGTVIYDSLAQPDNAEGEDYSRWNDVYLTLRGQYGARSTVHNRYERDSSVMYVAQPIIDNSGQTIGVVSVGKPVASVLPYLDNTRQRMLITALLVSIVALLLAGLVAWWLKQSITLVTRYTGTLAEDTQKPYFYLGHELNHLTDTIESMKHRLENRAYVSDYVHTLTHELKSPLTAIRASSELLEDDGLDIDDRQMLSHAIGEQSIKMQQLIDRLLLLAKVEQPTFKLNLQVISLIPMLSSLIKDSAPKAQQRDLATMQLLVNGELIKEGNANPDHQLTVLSKITINADSFWLVQALQNVLDNAIYFASTQVIIAVINVGNIVAIEIFNDGQPLPDYAIGKAFDRYFSLSHQSHSPRTNNNSNNLKKGTGLGLTLVKQVIEHHGGSVMIKNVDADTTNNESKGVIVTITLPLSSDKSS